MKLKALSKQVLLSNQAGGFEPVSPGSIVKVDVTLRGSGAIDTSVSLQVSDTPTDESSWVDSGLRVIVSGTDEATASDFALVEKRFYRLKPATLNGTSIYAIISEVEASDHPDRIVMLDKQTSVAKSKVFKLPSRKPITFEVHITGTATVRLYASNIEDTSNGTRWGAALREVTSSTKVVIENEPWVNWMVAYESGTGTANVAVGV